MVFLKHRGPEMCTYGVLRLSCEAPAAPKPPGVLTTARVGSETLQEGVLRSPSKPPLLPSKAPSKPPPSPSPCPDGLDHSFLGRLLVSRFLGPRGVGGPNTQSRAPERWGPEISRFFSLSHHFWPRPLLGLFRLVQKWAAKGGAPKHGLHATWASATLANAFWNLSTLPNVTQAKGHQGQAT